MKINESQSFYTLLMLMQLLHRLKITAIKPVIKTEGSQRGCSLWGKVKKDFYNFSKCYLVTVAAIDGHKQQNGLIPV